MKHEAQSGKAGELDLGPGALATSAALLWAAFLLHNVEEALALPDWAAERGIHITTSTFTTAVVGLSALTGAALWIGIGWEKRRNPTGRWLLAIVVGALLVNSFSHAVISLIDGSMMPGLLTGLLCMAPASVWLLVRLGRLGLSGTGIAMALAAGLALNPMAAAIALYAAGARP